MAVTVEIFQPERITSDEMLERSKAAVQKLANEYRAETEITPSDEAGNPIMRIVATPE